MFIKIKAIRFTNIDRKNRRTIGELLKGGPDTESAAALLSHVCIKSSEKMIVSWGGDRKLVKKKEE